MVSMKDQSTDAQAPRLQTRLAGGVSRLPSCDDPGFAQLDHRQVLAALTAEERRALTQKSDLRGGLQASAHIGLVAAGALWIAAGWPGWPAVLILHGIVTVFLFTAMHEASHATVFSSPRANRVLAAGCGVVLFLPPNWFRYYHFAHHRHTNDPNRDPELMGGGKPETWPAYLWHMTGVPTWWGQAQVLARNALGRTVGEFIPPRGRAKVIGEARIMLLSYACLVAISVAAGSALLFWIWLVPIALGQPCLRAYLLAEHARCPATANMLENSRTTFTGTAVRFLAWNMPFHAEHHAYPAVPFHKLPAFHSVTRAHLKSTASGYVAIHREVQRALG